MEPQLELAAEAPRPWARPVVVVPLLVLLALIGGQLPSFSTSANLYMLAIGGTMMWIGLSARVSRRPAPGRPGRAAAWWLLPVVYFAAIEGVTFVAGSRRYPTLSRIFDPLLADELVRSACFFGWLAAFWALVRR